MSLAYLASTERGHAVYMNRHVCDADLVVTVGCIRPPAARGYFGVHGSVYPGFADIDTLRRFQSQQAASRNGDNEKQHLLAREVDEAGWLLGARFTIQIIPGGGGEILHILSGDVDVVSREGARLSQKAWFCPITKKADLVVAALEGGARQQTWQNLYRALEAASQIVDDEGAVVLCTELDGPLDEMTLRALADDQDGEQGARDEPPQPAALTEVPTLEAVQPRRVIPALRDVSIYLLSAVNEQLIEDLGMVPVAKPSEVVNLCRQSKCCVVVSNAQHAWPKVDCGAVSPA